MWSLVHGIILPETGKSFVVRGLVIYHESACYDYEITVNDA